MVGNFKNVKFLQNSVYQKLLSKVMGIGYCELVRQGLSHENYCRFDFAAVMSTMYYFDLLCFSSVVLSLIRSMISELIVKSCACLMCCVHMTDSDRRSTKCTQKPLRRSGRSSWSRCCLLYTSDAADE